MSPVLRVASVTLQVKLGSPPRIWIHNKNNAAFAKLTDAMYGHKPLLQQATGNEESLPLTSNPFDASKPNLIYGMQLSHKLYCEE
jgi:hypothetical protein